MSDKEDIQRKKYLDILKFICSELNIYLLADIPPIRKYSIVYFAADNLMVVTEEATAAHISNFINHMFGLSVDDDKGLI